MWRLKIFKVSSKLSLNKINLNLLILQNLEAQNIPLHVGVFRNIRDMHKFQSNLQ